MNLCIYCHWENEKSALTCKNCGNPLDIYNDSLYNKNSEVVDEDSNKSRRTGVSLVDGSLENQQTL